LLRVHAKLFQSMVLIVDVLLSAFVFVAALSIPGVYEGGVGKDANVFALLVPALVASLAWPLILAELDLYESQRRETVIHILGRLLLAGVISTCLVAATTALTSAPVTRAYPLIVGAGQFMVLGALRFAVLVGIRLLRRNGRNYRNVIIVGSGTRARHVLHMVQRHREWGLRVVGFVDEGDVPHDPRLPADRVFKLVDLPGIIKDNVIDEVIVACPRSMLGSIGPVVAVCATSGVPMTLLSDLFGDYMPPPQVTSFGSLAALSFAPVHHSRSALAVKRAIDVVGSAVLLVAAAPIIGAAALAIRVTSDGPVFFRQMRCGKNGRPFRMVKMRTMCVDAEERKADLMALNEMEGPVFKMREDPRITKVGRILRRWSIDELPQFWNVFIGDMSLVGPRPPVPVEVAMYATFDRRRLSMRPGITCIWQVAGRNEIASFDDWVKMDLEYIDTWSLINDLRILLRTIPATLGGTGS